jgi:hypothetical protein
MEESNKNGAAPGVRVSPYPKGHWFGDDFDEDFDITETRLIYNVFNTTIYAGTYEWHEPDPDSETDGIIYIKYDDKYYNGNHYAVRWEDLHYDDDKPEKSTVWLSGCSDAAGKPTEDEARKEYTEANKDIYFKYGSNCHLGSEGKRIRPPRRPNEKPPFIKYLEEKTGKKFFD